MYGFLKDLLRFRGADGIERPSFVVGRGAMDVASDPHIDQVCRLLRRLHAGGVRETDVAVVLRPHRLRTEAVAPTG